MLRLLAAMSMAATLFGQYTLETAGAPPSELAPAISAELQKQGHKIASAGTTFCEIWFRSKAPSGPPSREISVTWNTVPHGSLIGAIRFPGEGKERRGQTIQPGTYTLRYSNFPVDGAHQGVEPSRDFLILSPAGIDKDPAATPSFEELMVMSRKASGTPHPAGLSMWKVEGDFQPGLTQLEEDWVLSAKVGDAPISVIVVGVNKH